MYKDLSYTIFAKMWTPSGLDTMGAQGVHTGNAVYRVGTTCISISCSDVVLIVTLKSANPLAQRICQEINNVLNVQNPSGVPPTDSNISMAGNEFIGTHIAAGSTGSYIGDQSSALSRGVPSACFLENTTGTSTDMYVYYTTLMVR